MEPKSADKLSDDEFIRLFSKSQCSLYAYILGLSYNVTDADDVLQEVNLALWRKRHSYAPDCDFLRWAVGFARIELANHRRKHVKNRLLFSDDVLNSLAEDWPKDTSHQELRLSALASCLQKLGATEGRYIAEFYRGEKTVDELSKRHNTPASTIYKILARARKSLRSCIQSTLAQKNHPA